MFACVLCTLPFVKSIMATIIVAALLGISYAALLPAWNGRIAEYVPNESHGTGWGVISTIEGSGVIIGPLIGGWLSERFDVALPFWVAASIFVIISAVYIVSPASRSRVNAVKSV
jgi:MFS family permease